MKPFQRYLAAAALTSFLSVSNADVLNFDDLPDTSVSPSGYFIADYHGFRFGNNDGATNPWFYAPEAHEQGLYFAHSGPNFIAVDEFVHGHFFTDTATLPISRATPFIFDGAWFSGYNHLAFDLYDGSTLVFASTPIAVTVASTFVPSGYAGAITSIVFVGPVETLGYFALDDLTYRDLAVATVPEPASVPLIASGVIVMALAGRRRRGRDVRQADHRTLERA